MTPRIITSPWPAIAAALVCVGVGYALKGRLDEGRIARAEGAVTACQRDREADARRAAEEAARRLSAAQAAEQAAQSQLATVQERLHATDARLHQALARVARANRMCMSADTRRVLDDARRDADRVPARTAEPDPAASAAAADPGGPSGAASERAVAEWAATAIRLYGECRARIDAIREWDEVTHGR